MNEGIVIILRTIAKALGIAIQAHQPWLLCEKYTESIVSRRPPAPILIVVQTQIVQFLDLDLVERDELEVLGKFMPSPVE